MNKAWSAIQELDFVTSFSTWLFMTLSRLAEPCMTLSSLYVIIQAGVPALHNDAVYNTAIACMLGAPEIILPGAFVLAGKEHARNKTASWILYVCASLFVALTIATLADLFIMHLQGQALNALMFARCAVSVGYSIVFRVITHTTRHTTANTTVNTPNVATQHTTQQPTKTRQKSRPGVATNTTKEIKVLSYRQRHPEASQSDIARALKLSVRTVQRHDNNKPTGEQRLHVVQ